VYKRYSNFCQFHEEVKKIPQVYAINLCDYLWIQCRFGTVILTHTRDGLCATLTNILTVQRLLCCQIDVIWCKKSVPPYGTLYMLCNFWNSGMILCCECFCYDYHSPCYLSQLDLLPLLRSKWFDSRVKSLFKNEGNL